MTKCLKMKANMEISLGQVWDIREQWHGIRSSGGTCESCQELE